MANLTFATVLTIGEGELLGYIKRMMKARKGWNERLHLASCAAVARAANPQGGRTAALQAIFDGLTKLEQDAFRAWLSVKADTFGVGKDNPEVQPWISWTKKDGQFKLLKGTDHRPTFDQISEVAAKSDKFFLNKKSGQVNRELAFEDELDKLIARVLKYVNDNAATEGVPADLVASLQTAKNKVTVFTAKRRVEHAQAAAVQPEPEAKPEDNIVGSDNNIVDIPAFDRSTGRRVLHDLSELGDAVNKLAS